MRSRTVQLAGVILALVLTAAACTHYGKKGTVCGGIQGILCPEGQFCQLPAGECKSADLQGECVEKPEICTREFNPVCGCDGKTYSNDCTRRAAGVQLDHKGECKGQVCGGIQGILCPEGQFCELPAGECKSADLQGTCAVRPELCTKEFRPVCGCDGKTYGNDCTRRAAGVQLDHKGEC